MPRNRSVGHAPAPSRAPTRPTVPASGPMPQQQRPAATMAAPTQHAPQQMAPAPSPAASQGPGLFGQMASTAAGVAIGSSVGHAIGGLFSGGSSEPAPQAQAQATQQQQQQQQQWGNNCQSATQQFTKCMDDNGGNMQICNWYLEQLKACQAAASQY
ncbi:CHCH domain protein [Metarhizium album ARSEF 1941]|uniref:CHCH domain protein n=1 Tax=Metarhizium album (strain ARSEF 1941) TaxID=1081103 RepID=A0A0B2WRK3_METAS|nr:CHCH domain protein [Metarhizium album ARSEF 1941]KHN98691.1 CHCH domain protein [Metarhizium album ARSEF 1941]